MLTELDEKGWELYNLREDFAETNNLAAKEKGRLISMIGMWYAEAGKYNVLPIDSRGLQRCPRSVRKSQKAGTMCSIQARSRFPRLRHHKFSTSHFNQR